MTKSCDSISVVIPNAREYPETLVTKLIKQFCNDDEIYIVRNHQKLGRDLWVPLTKSTTTTVVDRVACIESASGAASARNAGWQAAKNPWILFLDDDIDVPSDMLERLRHYTSLGLTGVFCLCVRSGNGQWSDVIESTISLDRGSGKLSSDGKQLVLADTWRFGVGAAIFVRRDLLVETGGFKEQLGAGRHWGGAEDLEFLWHASRHTTLQYIGHISVTHATMESIKYVICKFRHYGRAIGHLAGTAKGDEGMAMVSGYCKHMLISVFCSDAICCQTVRDRLVLRFAAIRAASATFLVFLVSLLWKSRKNVLCRGCQ